MPAMTDPNDALVSFTAAFRARSIMLAKCETVDDLWVHHDEPLKGVHRLTYAFIARREVKGIVIVTPVDPVDGVRCFGIGYAVPDVLRGRGIAKKIVADAIGELRHGLSEAGVKHFFVEAIISVDNQASQAVAAATISSERKPTKDSHSGNSAFQYMLEIDDRQLPF